MTYLEYRFIIMLLIIPLDIGVKMLIGRRTYEHVKSRLLYDLIKAVIRLPFRLISLIVKFPRS